MQWYYVKGYERIGPLEEDEFFKLAKSGAILPGDLVWNSSMGEQWVAASTVPGLLANPPSTPTAQYPRRTTPNRELMRTARERLGGNWGLAVGAYLIYLVIMSVSGPASLILAGPMMVGLYLMYLAISRNQKADLGQLFRGFNMFVSALGAYLLMCLFILLWCLLLIVPGIIAAFSYAMTFFIIAEDDSIGPLEAITKSKQMMRGRKWKLFCLCWRFFGWFLLCLLTCGVGFIFLIPYVNTAYARFYDDVK